MFTKCPNSGQYASNHKFMKSVTTIVKQPESLALATVWLFTISAMVGITMGYLDWFMTKTPLNMLILCSVLLWFYPIRTWRQIAFVGFVFIGSLLVEAHGVAYGILFGPYRYLTYLGPKVAGVPWLIGINWTILVLCTGALATAFFEKKWMRVLVGASMMTLFDAIMEPLAPRLHFWVFDAGMPNWVNYAGWMGTALVFHTVYQALNLSGHVRVSAHVFASQVLFFLYITVLYGI